MRTVGCSRVEQDERRHAERAGADRRYRYEHAEDRAGQDGERVARACGSAGAGASPKTR